MFRSNLLWGGAAASGLLLTAVVGQEAVRDPAAARPAVEGGALVPGDQADAAGPVDPASLKPTDHFLAGYYAGYGDGYLDGGEDTAAEAAERQQALADRHAADGWHPDRMQPGRRQARESLRAHMRGEEAADRVAEERAEGAVESGPAETVAGTVVGVKTVPIVGTRIVHRVVRLQTEDGSRRVADLGPTDQTDGLDIARGDELTVEGVPVMTADMRITAGRRVTKGDREARVNYPKLDVTDEAGGQTPQAAEIRPEGERPQTETPRTEGPQTDRPRPQAEEPRAERPEAARPEAVRPRADGRATPGRRPESRRPE